MIVEAHHAVMAVDAHHISCQSIQAETTFGLGSTKCSSSIPDHFLEFVERSLTTGDSINIECVIFYELMTRCVKHQLMRICMRDVRERRIGRPDINHRFEQSLSSVEMCIRPRLQKTATDRVVGERGATKYWTIWDAGYNGERQLAKDRCTILLPGCRGEAEESEARLRFA